MKTDTLAIKSWIKKTRNFFFRSVWPPLTSVTFAVDVYIYVYTDRKLEQTLIKLFIL